MKALAGKHKYDTAEPRGENIVGLLGAIDNAWSPHHGEIVEIIGLNGDMLTVVPSGPTGFTFSRAELHRNDVRIL